jgi:predicted phage baseplate assembly protein
MSSLKLSLDDTNFEALFESARLVIPVVAPDWTDHNFHDPGITLIDLLAWAADQQIYALGHSRLDERLGYAALLGLRPRGPSPASGLIWPPAGVSLLPTGIALERGKRIEPTRAEAPRFTAAHDVYLIPARLAALRTMTAAGEQIAWPSAEPPRGSVLLPFGASPARGARLELTLDGSVLTEEPDPKRRPFLSIGFRTEEKPQDASDPVEPRQGRLRARLRAELQSGNRTVRLPIWHDQTAGFTRSGVLLIDLTPTWDPPTVSPSSLRLTLRSAQLPVPPRLSAVAINVVPVRQEIVQDVPALGDPPIRSTGLPDQQVQLDAQRTRFGKGVATPKVTVEQAGTRKAWTLSRDLSTAGPKDEVFAFDTANAVIRFGNGVNGKIPPAGADLAVSCLGCSGIDGNLPAGMKWKVPDTKTEFHNPEPMRGGADRLDVAELRRQARRKLAADRPLVTDVDLAAAALACRDLRVGRAHVLDEFDPRRRPGHAGATRTLVVVRDDSGSEPGVETESTAWLRALRQRLMPNLPLGDRVRIIGPLYMDLRLRAQLVIAPNRNAAAIREKARCLLEARLAPVAAAPGGDFWPLGRDVAPHDLMGWLRRIDGVVAVRELRIGSRVNRVGDEPLKIPRHGLPRLLLEPDDISIEPASRGGCA